MGFRIGHWTDRRASTGCTVVLPPPGNVTSCDIRGSSPSERELALLHPDRRLTEVHAVLLTGGSAFGLAAADGVVSWLEERGIGYETSVARVPIVPAAVVFDLASGRADVRPGATEGRAACEAATEAAVETGRVGAGAGATVGKWAGRDRAAPGGLGIATASSDSVEVSAVAVVNSVGDIVDEDGSVLAGSTKSEPLEPAPGPVAPSPLTNTVVGLIATRANLDKREVRWLAARGSDGITTSIRPAHTRYDGDVVFAVAAPRRGDELSDLDVLGRLATQAMAGAIRSSVAAVSQDRT
jgi:L-aminopeptidase/D-esterase-like protein